MSEPDDDGTYDLYIDDHLDQLITQSGLTSEEIARRAGMSYPHLRGVARGERPVTVRTAQRLAKVLGVSLTIILGGAAERLIPSGRILASGELMSDDGPATTLPGYFTASSEIPGLCPAGALVLVSRSAEWSAGRYLAIRYENGRVRLRKALARDNDRWLLDEMGDESRYDERRHAVIGRVVRAVLDFE